MLPLLAAAALLLGPATPSQAQMTRGSLGGTVRDDSGGVLPGVTVTVTNEATGIARTVVTNEVGFYRAPALEPGQYSVVVELSGFRRSERKGVQVASNTETTYTLELKVGGLTDTIVVEDVGGQIELNKTNATLATTATARQAAELPLSAGRNINNLALLGPNTFTAPGSTGISANGNRARNNNFMIDGTDNNDLSVTIQTTPVLPEEVAEFSSQTASFSAEFGRSSGAQINVITRSGTNSFRGEAWDYYRSAGLGALDNIEKSNSLRDPTKFVRHQAGASLGGPLNKNRTFFFVLFQRDSNRTGQTLGGTVRIPTQAGFAALQNVPLRAGQSAASRQAVLQRLSFLQDVYSLSPTLRNVQNQTVNGVSIETAQTNIGRFTHNTTYKFTGRLDHKLGEKDSVTARYSLNNPDSLNATSNTAFGSIFAANQTVKDHNGSLSHTHIFSASALNEFRASYIRRDLQFPENDPTSPTATITGLFTIGGASNFPQGRIQNSFQFTNTTSLLRGRHTFKFGADVRYNKLDNQAAFDSKGTFGFSSLQNYMNNLATTYNQALQTSSFLAKQWQTFLYAQDDFRVNPDLTLNLGVRYEISTVPLGFFGATDAESLGALVPAPVKKDTNNVAPRIGFAWSPEQRTSIRGGYGIGYDVLFYNILTVNAANFPRVVVPQVTNALDIYPNIQTASGAAVFNPQATYVNSAENTQNPMSHFYSLSAQRELGRDIILDIGYTGSTGRHGVNQQQANPAILTPAQAALVASTGNQTAIPGTQARRLNPAVGSRILIPADIGPGGNDVQAKSQYHALFVSLNKRMSHGVQAGLAYTLSRFKSNNDESLGVGAITSSAPQIPQDYFDISSEYALSVFDRTHRLSVNYIWEIPGPKSGVLKQIIGGWQLSGVTSYQSGQPFGILTGQDTNGNGGGGDRPNLTGSGSFDWDSEHKGFTNNGFYTVPRGSNGAVLPFSLGNGNAQKTAHRGARSVNTDASLAKNFTFRGKRLNVRIDAFNLFNQDDYGVPVTSMSSTDFGNNLNNWGNRSLTLSGKFSF
ncbi:MAG: TonB-dependent receptor [Vicinamibacteria bacterium]|nr:TonB-dependent receptor [Vicinamibacteria bacterium]